MIEVGSPNPTNPVKSAGQNRMAENAPFPSTPNMRDVKMEDNIVSVMTSRLVPLV
ncbi:hypothetical protein MT997_10350 [Paenibacillus sp. OVF10]|nr:hypothetical protein MT997_10350 [Paenibacillus sp. OVF10]